MTGLLCEVFGSIATSAHSITKTIDDSYLRLGFFVWRLMHDEKFLSLSPAAVDSPLLRHGVEVYDAAKTQAQALLSDSFGKTVRTADYEQKPDIKPGLLNLAKTITPYLGRVNTGHPLFVAGVAITVAFAGYAISQMGAGHEIQNTAASLYGTTNQPKPNVPS